MCKRISTYYFRCHHEEIEIEYCLNWIERHRPHNRIGLRCFLNLTHLCTTKQEARNDYHTYCLECRRRPAPPLTQQPVNYLPGHMYQRSEPPLPRLAPPARGGTMTQNAALRADSLSEVELQRRIDRVHREFNSEAASSLGLREVFDRWYGFGELTGRRNNFAASGIVSNADDERDVAEWQAKLRKLRPAPDSASGAVSWLYHSGSISPKTLPTVQSPIFSDENGQVRVSAGPRRMVHTVRGELHTSSSAEPCFVFVEEDQVRVNAGPRRMVRKVHGEFHPSSSAEPCFVFVENENDEDFKREASKVPSSFL